LFYIFYYWDILLRVILLVKYEQASIFLKNAFPINVLNRIKNISEIVNVFCATANPTEVIVAETEQGRGIMGVIDGGSPVGVENESQEKERKEFLRKIGYKQ